MITIQRTISADIRSIIINTALATVELIMTVIDDLIGLVGVGDCIVEMITEDVIPRKREVGAWSILTSTKNFLKKMRG